MSTRLLSNEEEIASSDNRLSLAATGSNPSSMGGGAWGNTSRTLKMRQKMSLDKEVALSYSSSPLIPKKEQCTGPIGDTLKSTVENTPTSCCVDIGINITSKQLKGRWRKIVQDAVDKGVRDILLTGTSMKSSRESLRIANTWEKQTGEKNLFCTVGIHPHDAKSFSITNTIDEMKYLLNDPIAVAIGECGLDYNRNFSPKEKQIECFRAQIALAVELQYPLFVHEREAFEDTIAVFEEFKGLSLPPVVVHCFTGTLQEANAYIERGFFIGFTGTICKKERGAPLRDILPQLPLDRLMIETDAPWMGFLKTRRISEPADVILVAEELARVIGAEPEEVKRVTTQTAKAFFRIETN